MSTAEDRLDAASRAALARRARIKAGGAALKQRLTVARLVDDGKRHVQAQAKAVVADSKAHVRAHPVLTGLAIAGLLGWIFRKPLLAYSPPLARRLYDWLAGKLPFRDIVAEDDLAHGVAEGGEAFSDDPQLDIPPDSEVPAQPDPIS